MKTRARPIRGLAAGLEVSPAMDALVYKLFWKLIRSIHGRRKTRLLAISLMGLASFIAISAPSAYEPEPDPSRIWKIAILFSAPLDFPATEMTERGIREALLPSTTFHIQLFAEYLDLSRFRDPKQREALATLLEQRYARGAADLIICVDVPAANFLLERAETVLPGIPIIMCSLPQALKDRLENSPLRKRICCVFEPANAKDFVTSALALRPSAKHAAFISGAFENDELRGVDVRKTLESFQDRLRLIDLSGLPIGKLLEDVKKLPPDTLIFYSTFFVDGKGRSFVPRNVLRMISDETQVPVFGRYESFLGAGIVGGPLTSLRLQGKRAGEMAVRVLHGEAPGDIPFDYGVDTCVLAYDWRQLKRWGINEKALPSGAAVLYREASMWDLYSSYILAAISLMVLESVLILALVVNLQKRKRAEVELRESRQDLRTLAGRLISSQEEELSRLSREFHDDLAQRLAAVAIESGTLELRSRNIEEPVVEKIRYIKEQLIGLSEDVHAISRQLHPAILRDLGLVSAMKSHCMRFSTREKIPVVFEAHNVPETILNEIALCLYRVVQESLRNVVKHGHARNIEVYLQGGDGNITVEIRDDGIGFNPQDARQNPGIGLASMRERVDYVNGRLNIRSEPGNGTVIGVSVPAQRRNG